MTSHNPRTRRRIVLLTAVAVVTAAALGWWAGRGITSPSDAARRAAPPVPSDITAAVERRALTTEVTTRGDVVFAESVEIIVDTDLGEGADPAVVVTGKVPKAGELLDEGDVALEVSGRPIMLLEGGLPRYRALRPGDVGPDVLQLEQALRRLGHLTADADNRYDSATASAVGEWYAAAGYPPVGPSAEEQQRLTAARQEAAAATAGLEAARLALMEARTAVPESERLAAMGEVEVARVEVDQARRAVDAACGGPVGDGCDEAELRLAAARSALRVAEARLRELTAQRDISSQRRAVTRAVETERQAKRTLAEITATMGVRVPRGEVAFVPSLPRRADDIQVELGGRPDGPALRLAGAQIHVDTAVPPADLKSLRPGMEVAMDEPELGIDTRGVVESISETPGTDGAPPGLCRVRVRPDTAAGLSDAVGANVRVRIPVGSTGGAVLVVPLAALTTDAGGTVRVRVRHGGGFADVVVEPGLASDGFAEVTPTVGGLAEGDEVIVGVEGGPPR